MTDLSDFKGGAFARVVRFLVNTSIKRFEDLLSTSDWLKQEIIPEHGLTKFPISDMG